MHKPRNLLFLILYPLPHARGGSSRAARKKSADGFPPFRHSPRTPASIRQPAASLRSDPVPPRGLPRTRYGENEPVFPPKQLPIPTGQPSSTDPTSSQSKYKKPGVV